MIDLPAPPFRAGDLAYGRPSPGGYATAAATPTDPQFGGSDAVYNVVPALGGDFQPGSGTPAANTSPVSKGSPADGGAQKIDDAPRVGAPTPPVPPVVPELDGSINGPWVIFTGVPSDAGRVTVTYDNEGVPYNVIVDVAEGDSAGAVAAKVAARLNESGNVVARQTSNAVEVRYPDGSVAGDLAVVVVVPAP